MNQDELIEAILKEVKRVLALRGIPVTSSPAASTSAVSPAAPAPVTDVTVQSVGSRDMAGKQVITQRDLESFQGQSITVSKKAVITPLAIDYAKEKGITINRNNQVAVPKGGGGDQQPTVTAALAVAPDFPSDSMVVKNFLVSKGVQVKEFSGKSYETAVNNLANAVSSGAVNFGICVEKTGMLGPIYANRNKNIRAVHCRETFDARAARVDIGANVIVLDSVSNPEAVISGFMGLS